MRVLRSADAGLTRIVANAGIIDSKDDVGRQTDVRISDAGASVTKRSKLGQADERWIISQDTKGLVISAPVTHV